MSQAAIAGSSESYFYLDTRPITAMNEAPTVDDLQPVFKIVSSGEITDSDAEDLESKIVTNQEYFGYWSNFDNPIDTITVLFYLLALVSIANGVRLMMSEDESDEAMKAEAAPAEEESSEEASEATE